MRSKIHNAFSETKQEITSYGVFSLTMTNQNKHITRSTKGPHACDILKLLLSKENAPGQNKGTIDLKPIWM